MKLSTAIRKGCELSSYQVKGHYFDGEGGSCALGAAALACGSVTQKAGKPEYVNPNFNTAFPVLHVDDVIHPETEERQKMSIILVSLNDEYDYSREEVADFVESWEQHLDREEARKLEVVAVQ